MTCLLLLFQIGEIYSCFYSRKDPFKAQWTKPSRMMPIGLPLITCLPIIVSVIVIVPMRSERERERTTI